MILANIKEKGKVLLRKDVYTAIVIVLVGVASFGLGRLSFTETEQLHVEIANVFPEASVVIATENATEEGSVPPSNTVAEQGLFVGSKNSNKYHYPWCPGAVQMKEENKVWFASVEEAKSRGYVPAGNCKGL